MNSRTGQAIQAAVTVVVLIVGCVLAATHSSSDSAATHAGGDKTVPTSTPTPTRTSTLSPTSTPSRPRVGTFSRAQLDAALATATELGQPGGSAHVETPQQVSGGGSSGCPALDRAIKESATTGPQVEVDVSKRYRAGEAALSEGLENAQASGYTSYRSVSRDFDECKELVFPNGHSTLKLRLIHAPCLSDCVAAYFLARGKRAEVAGFLMFGEIANRVTVLGFGLNAGAAPKILGPAGFYRAVSRQAEAKLRLTSS